MKINYDKNADAVYIRLGQGKVVKTIKMTNRLIVDIDRAGRILGLEILDASSQISKQQINDFRVGMPVSV